MNVSLKDRLIRNRQLICLGIIISALFLSASIFGIITSIAGVVLLLNDRRGHYGVQDLKYLFPASLFFLGIIGLLWSEDTSSGGKVVERNLSLIIFPIIFLFTKKLSEKQFKTLMYWFVFNLILVSLICYGNAIFNIVTNDSFKVITTTERPYYYYSYIYLTEIVRIDPIYLGGFANMGLALILFDRNLLLKIRVSLSIYLFIFIYLIASKIAIICAIVFVVMSLFDFFSRSTLVKRTLVFSALACCLVIFLNTSFLRERFISDLRFNYGNAYSGDWDSYSQRLAIWSSSVIAIKNAPWYGYGTGSGQHQLEKSYSDNGYIRGIEDKYNAHNEFIQKFLDLGILGVGLWIATLFSLLTGLQNPSTFRLRLAFFLILLFTGLIESYLLRQKGVSFFSVFYCLLVNNVDFSKR